MSEGCVQLNFGIFCNSLLHQPSEETVKLTMSREQPKISKYFKSQNSPGNAEKVHIKFEPKLVKVKEEPEIHFVLFLPQPQMHLV